MLFFLDMLASNNPKSTMISPTILFTFKQLPKGLRKVRDWYIDTPTDFVKNKGTPDYVIYFEDIAKDTRIVKCNQTIKNSILDSYAESHKNNPHYKEVLQNVEHLKGLNAITIDSIDPQKLQNELLKCKLPQQQKVNIAFYGHCAPNNPTLSSSIYLDISTQSDQMYSNIEEMCNELYKIISKAANQKQFSNRSEYLAFCQDEFEKSDIYKKMEPIGIVPEIAKIVKLCYNEKTNVIQLNKQSIRDKLQVYFGTLGTIGADCMTDIFNITQNTLANNEIKKISFDGCCTANLNQSNEIGKLFKTNGKVVPLYDIPKNSDFSLIGDFIYLQRQKNININFNNIKINGRDGMSYTKDNYNNVTKLNKILKEGNTVRYGGQGALNQKNAESFPSLQ